jgi:hypothetical protein
VRRLNECRVDIHTGDVTSGEEDRVREMACQLMEKEGVIQELDRAARERQEIINQLLAERR